MKCIKVKLLKKIDVDLHKKMCDHLCACEHCPLYCKHYFEDDEPKYKCKWFRSKPEVHVAIKPLSYNKFLVIW